MEGLMLELAEPLLDIGLGHNTGKNIDDIEPCELHFIRCIKPNEVKQANVFWNSMVLQQITYMGVLESIKVKQINYPYRRTYQDFYERYEQLCSISATK